jgi:hypothetical protein
VMLIPFAGLENRNRFEFTGCKQYGSESSISFDSPSPVEAPAGPAKPAAPREMALAPGLVLRMRLETSLDTRTVEIGAPIRARLESDAMEDGKVVVPRGAMVNGRVRRTERIGQPVPHVVLGLEFFEIEWDQRRAVFTGRLESMSPVAPPETGGRGRYMQRMTQTIVPGGASGVGVVAIPGERVRVPRGVRMVWRTVAAHPAR